MSNEHSLVLTPDERSQFEGLQSEFLRISDHIGTITSMTSETIAELWNALHTFDTLQRGLVRLIESTRENILELLDAHTMQVVGTADAIIQACTVDDSPAPTTGALLDQFSVKYKEVFMRRVRQVPVRFFTPMLVQKGEASGDSAPRHTEVRNGHKLDILLQILAKHNVGSNTIHILEETLQENQMRALPYYTVYLENPICTICISDQIGERTYVYPGVLVSAMQLASIQKQESVEGTNPIGVTLGTWYAERLEAAIFTSNRTSTVFRDTQADAPTTLAPEQQALLDNAVVDPVVMQEEGLERVLQMQMDILGIQKELEDVGVIFWNGRVCTGEMQGQHMWPKINGKRLVSYPNAEFLRRHSAIPDKQVHIQSAAEFSTLLRILGFPVVTKNNETQFLIAYDKAVRCPKYKKEIEAIQNDLEKAGVIFWNGQVCTANINEHKQWPKINGKNLRNYPNAEFLRRHKVITDNQEHMQSGIYLRAMLQVIGFSVATEEESFLITYDTQVNYPRYKQEIEMNQNTLKEIGIIFWNGKVCISEMTCDKKWPQICDKNLRSYPSATFLHRHGIIAEEENQISSSAQFSKLLQLIGFSVTSDADTEEYLRQYDKAVRYTVYKAEIESIQAELEAIGVIYWDGKVCTAEMQGEQKWPKINNKLLVSYPNAEFLRRHNVIPDKQVHIQSAAEFSTLLRILGFPVVTEKDETQFLIAYDKAVRCPKYKEKIEAIQNDLEKVGVIFWNGQVCTCELKSIRDWPEIDGKNLANYPNAEFLRRHGIINENQDHMGSSVNVANLLQILGFSVVIENNETQFLIAYDKAVRCPKYKKEIEAIQNDLEKVGVIFWNGQVCVRELQNESQWPQINGKRLVSYPNAEFLRRHNIIKNNQERMTSNLALSLLLQIIGYSVVTDIHEDLFLFEYDKEVRCPKYKEEIEEIQNDLEKVGVIFWNGQVCTAKMKVYSKWPKIHGKNLTNFPNPTFLRRYEIIKTNQGKMQNRQEFSALLRVLGFTVVDTIPQE